MEERNQSVDILKGYACFLVVFGHVIMGIRKAGMDVPVFFYWLEKFIWTYHVDLFMFLSGYVYSLIGAWKKQGTRTKFILYKLINLGIPYFCFSIVYIVINSLMGSSVNNALNLTDIFNLWRIPVAQYWFIYVLFFLFLFYVSMSKILKDWQIIGVLFIINILVRITGISLGYIQVALDMSIVFGVGVIIKRINYGEKALWPKICIMMVHILCVSIALVYGFNKIFVLEEMIALLGIFASIAFVSLISKVNTIKSILLFICRYSFPIYLLHTIFTAGLRIMMTKLSISNYFIQVIMGTVVGILVPVIIAYISNKLVFTDFVFYPVKTYKKIYALRKKS